MSGPTGSVVPTAVEKLKQPVGPLPLWMWGAGAITAYMIYRYMATGSVFGSGGDDEGGGGMSSELSDGSIQAVDPATVAAYKGEPGEQGEQGLQGIQGEQGIQGPKGDTGPAVSRPTKPSTQLKTGYKWWFDVQKWKWVQRKVPAKPKTKLKKNYKWVFNTSTWSWKQQHKALGGPFIGAAEVGEVGRENVYGIGFVKPKYPILKSPANNSQPTVSGIHIDAPTISHVGFAGELLPEYPELPNMIGKVPVLVSDRGYGRPFFGSEI